MWNPPIIFNQKLAGRAMDTSERVEPTDSLQANKSAGGDGSVVSDSSVRGF